MNTATATTESTIPAGVLADAGETPPENPDVALVRGMADGESSALGNLYQRHSRLLLALATRILGNRPDAEEVVQESLFYAWRSAGRYDPSRASVTTWLTLIVRSRCLDRQRSHQAEQRKRLDLGRETRDRRQEPAGFDQVLESQRQRRVRKALLCLPAGQREVLELSFYQGLTHLQIAERTGLPLGTAKTRILLAMKRLRRHLQPEIQSLR